MDWDKDEPRDQWNRVKSLENNQDIPLSTYLTDKRSKVV